MVICLSHIGTEQKAGHQGNKKLAAISNSIDLIISSHNSTVVPPQMICRNKQKNQVVIANAGYGGSIIGKLNFTYNGERKLQTFDCKNFIPGIPASTSFYEGYKKLIA
jgi:5'-nucleotidase